MDNTLIFAEDGARNTTLFTGGAIPIGVQDAIDAAASAASSATEAANSASEAAGYASELAGAVALSLYPLRSLFVNANNLGVFDYLADGTTLTVEGLRYVRNASSTAIPDLPGWVPVAPVWPEHWNIVDNLNEVVTYNGVPVTYNSETLTYDGAANATALVNSLIKYTAEEGLEVEWGPGPYRFDMADYEGADPRVKWSSRSGNTVMFSTKSTPDGSSYEADYFIKIRGSMITSGTINQTLVAGVSRLTLDAAAVAAIKENDSLLHIQTNRVIETDDRGQARVGWTTPISRIISNTVVELAMAVPMAALSGSTTGLVVTAVNASARTVTIASRVGTSVVNSRYRLDFTTIGGVASTMSRLPSKFDPDTGTFTFASGYYPTGVSVGDTVTINRTISYTLSNSVKADIQGITFERALHTGATAGDTGFRGLYLARCLRPVLKDVVARNFSETGIRVESSYAPRFNDIELWNANRAYNVDDGTGYGISVYQCVGGSFENIQGFGCRRVLDFAGTQMCSWDNVTNDVTGYGGGTAYDDLQFWPNGPTLNTVVGSHGAAYRTNYVNSRGVSTYGIVNIRGEDETVDGIYGCGKMQEMLHVFYGDGVFARGFYYTDGRPDWVLSADTYSKSSRNGKLQDVISIDSTVNGYKPHHFADIVVRGVKRSVVSCDGGPMIGGLSLGGLLDIQVDNEDADFPIFSYVRASGTGTPVINGPVDLGRPMIKNKIGQLKTTINLMTMSNFTFGDNSYVKWPDGSVRFYLATNDFRRLMVQASETSIVDAHIIETGSAVKCQGVALAPAGRENAAVIGQSVGITYQSVPLTGTTGGSGTFSLAFNPSGASYAALYVENRLGSRKLVSIKCSELAV